MHESEGNEDDLFQMQHLQFSQSIDIPGESGPKLTRSSNPLLNTTSIYDVNNDFSKLIFNSSSVMPPLPTQVKIITDNEEIAINEIIVPPDGGWGWVITFAAFYVNMINDGLLLSLALMVDSIQESFVDSGQTSVTKSQVAWIPSLFYGFICLGGPVSAAVSNKYGFRVAAILGSVISSIGLALAGLSYGSSPSLPALFIFVGCIGGCGCSLGYVPSVVAVGYYFDTHRALAASICASGTGVGQLAFSRITDTILKNYGWKIHMTVAGGLLLCCAISGALMRPLKPTKMVPVPVKEDEAEGGENDSDIKDIILKSKAALHGKATAVSVSPLASRTISRLSPIPSQANPAKSQLIYSGPLLTVPTVSAEKAHPTEPERFKRSSIESGDSDKEGSKIIAKIGHSTFRIDGLTGSREVYNDAVDASALNKPLLRDDIFFAGSMIQIPAYAETVGVGAISKPEWTMIVTQDPALQMRRADVRRRRRCPCYCLKRLSVVNKMLDLSLFASPTFLLYLASQILSNTAFYIPQSYLKGIALQKGLTEEDALVFLTCFGMSNMVSRLLCGFVVDRCKLDPKILYLVALTTSGVSTLTVPLYSNFYWLYVVYAVIFGMSAAFYICLLSSVLVALLGLDKLTNAFGLSCMFQGVAIMIGIPIAGALSEVTGTYDSCYIFGGTILTLAAVTMYPCGYVNRQEKNKKTRFS